MPPNGRQIGAVRALETPGGASAALLAAALDAAPVPAMVVAADGNLLFVNQALTAATGHAAADLRGQPARQLFAEAARAAFDAAWGAAQGGYPWWGDAALVRKDGSFYDHELSVAPVRAKPGSAGAAEVVLLCQDTASRRLSPERLVAADRLLSLGALVSGITHDINNPLSLVLANLTFVIEVLPELQATSGPRPDETMRELNEAVSEMRRGAERVRDLVRNLAVFARPTTTGRQPLDVEPLLESSIAMAWSEIRRRARLERAYAAGLPKVEADEGQLGQVFVDLLVNAAQAIGDSGAEENEIRVATRTDPMGRVVIEIRDTGPGIPEAVRRRLFEPFSTTKPAGVGHGLGLYASREIIRGLGGTLEVESAGRGTTFKVTLPAHAARPQAAPHAASHGPSPERRGRVLVIDDDPMIGATIARVLSAHEVVLLAKAADALGRISRGETFDLILCDLMMPGMSGMELYLELSRRSPGALEKIVFLTGGICAPEVSDFLDQVQNTVLEKPFDPPTLRAFVAERVGAGHR
jgi:PAS domain S-box-containing protein